MLHSPRLFLDRRLLRTFTAGLIKRYAAMFRGRYVVERRMGLWLLLDQHNAVDRHLLFRGFWEQAQIEYLNRLVAALRADPRPRLFLDIGSHAALYALLMRQTGAFERLIAFEPAPVNLVQLRANLLLNQTLDGIEVVEAAVSDRIGQARFLVENDSNRGMSRLVGADPSSTRRVIDVPTLTIDAHLPAVDSILVIKIDVEGAELEVLAGMSETLSRNDVVLQIERNSGPFEDLARHLAPYGVTHLRSLGHDHYFASQRLALATA